MSNSASPLRCTRSTRLNRAQICGSESSTPSKKTERTVGESSALPLQSPCRGRGYCTDMFQSDPAFAPAMLRVLDIAFACARSGGLLLIMGLLLAVTFMFVPLLALLHNSTTKAD